jgi:hypothetical protein
VIDQQATKALQQQLNDSLGKLEAQLRTAQQRL